MQHWSTRKIESQNSKLPCNLQEHFTYKNDFGDLMKTHAEKEGLTSQPRKMLIQASPYRTVN